MADPTPAHTEAIHVTAASDTVLADANKIEETSTFSLDGEHTIIDRQNLNSPGHTLRSVTWHAYSGSLEGRVIRGSTVMGTIETAAAAGTSAFIHIIDTPGAALAAHKGWRYEVVFGTDGKSWPAGDVVGFSISFAVSGAPVELLGTV